tara:strand:+ start:462 stop:1244 length:783 start_codon:yes stop_codon:yes gene_type:complete
MFFALNRRKKKLTTRSSSDRQSQFHIKQPGNALLKKKHFAQKKQGGKSISLNRPMTCGISEMPQKNQESFSTFYKKKKRNIDSKLSNSTTTLKKSSYIERSSYIEAKKINRLRMPRCCQNTSIDISFDSGLTEIIAKASDKVVKQLIQGCKYNFHWQTVGDIISISKTDVSNVTTYFLDLCPCPSIENFVITASNNAIEKLNIPIVSEEYKKTCVKNISCNNCTLRKTTHKRTNFVKNLKNMSSNDYIARKKGKKSCFCS